MKAFLSLFLFFLSGCMGCRNDECPGGQAFIFKVRDSGGRNLLPWSSDIQSYDSDSVKVAGLAEEGQEKPMKMHLKEGILRFQPEAEIETYLIRYSFAADDTIELRNLKVYSDDCCHDIVTEYEAKENGHFTMEKGGIIFIFTK